MLGFCVKCVPGGRVTHAAEPHRNNVICRVAVVAAPGSCAVGWVGWVVAAGCAVAGSGRAAGAGGRGFRGSIARCGAVPAGVPVWLSRQAWISEVRGWADSAGFGALRARLGTRAVISPAALVAVAVGLAGFADHRSGRNAAVTNRVLAGAVGCSVRTVSTARTVLGAAGFGIEARRGHGSPGVPRAARRPSIWHLISPSPAAAPAPAAAPDHPHSRTRGHRRAVHTCDLPPKAGSCCCVPVRSYSPSVRAGARDTISSSEGPPTGRRARRWRTAPRPLALQRLAAGLVAPAQAHSPDDRGRTTALIAGLDGVHLGQICDAITAAGIDHTAWSPRALTDALTADMRATGLTWPERIERPAAFFAARLQRLPTRPHTSTPKSPDHRRRHTQAQDQARTQAERDAHHRDIAERYAQLCAATTATQRTRLLDADTAKYGRRSPSPTAALAHAARKATTMFPHLELTHALNAWADHILNPSPVSQMNPTSFPNNDIDHRHNPQRPGHAPDLTTQLAIDAHCVLCGTDQATPRTDLPLASMVCDRCWPHIAADLTTTDPVIHHTTTAA